MTRPGDQCALPTAQFDHLTGCDWVAAAGCARRVSLRPAQVLFRSGDLGDAMYVVISGEVDVTTGTGDGLGPPLATLGPGAIAGEHSLFAAGGRNATIVARSDVELWEIEREGLVAAVGARESWAVELLLTSARELARRLSRLDRELASLMAEARIADKGPQVRVAELEDLRRRLFTEWMF